MPKIPNRGALPGVLSRKLPRTLVCATIAGANTVITQSCDCCHRTLPLSAFYLESSSKKRRVDQVRKQCVECWDEYKGKKPKDLYQPSVTLDVFTKG
jgi:hypothetical protein